MEMELGIRQDNPRDANLSELGKVAPVVEYRPHEGVYSVGSHRYVSFGRGVSG